MSIIIIRNPLVALLYQLGLFTRPSGTIEAVQEGQAGAIGIYLLVDHLQVILWCFPWQIGFSCKLSITKPTLEHDHKPCDYLRL